MTIIALLFLAHFAIFSVSPLYCSLETDQNTGNGLNESGQTQYSLYLVDLFVSGFDNDKGTTAGQSGQTDDERFLVKKKRATLSSTNKLKAAGSYTTVEKVFTPQVSNGPTPRSPGQQQYLHPAQNLLFPLYSGNAPPSV